MTLAFIVSSAIDTNQGKGQNFPYSLNRSVFTPKERLRQTQGTLNALKLIDDTADIYLLDVSDDASAYNNELKYIPRLNFIDINEIDKDIAKICRDNPSKGLCEASANIVFFNNYYNKLKNYDYIIKITGRYFFSKFNKNIFNESNTDKYIIGAIRKFNWNSNWNYPEFLNYDNKLHWVPTWAYGFGKQCLTDYYDGYNQILNFYNQNPNIAPYMDLECLFYQYIIKDKNIVSAPWTINGWNGVSGKFFTE